MSSVTELGNNYIKFIEIPADRRAADFVRFRKARSSSEMDSKANQLCCLLVLGILLAASAAAGSYAVAKYVGTTNALAGTISGFAALTIIYVVAFVRLYKAGKLLFAEEKVSQGDADRLKDNCIRAKPLVEFLFSSEHNNRKIELLYNLDRNSLNVQRLLSYLDALIKNGVGVEVSSLTVEPSAIKEWKSFIEPWIASSEEADVKREEFMKNIDAKREEAEAWESSRRTKTMAAMGLA